MPDPVSQMPPQPQAMPQGQQQQPQGQPMAPPGQQLPPPMHPTKDPRWGPAQQQAFTGPIPGQSLTMMPKSTPWQRPPQFPKLEDTMDFLMDQLIEPQHLKEILFLMKNDISIEEIARVLIFTGFAEGKWLPSVAMLMYKPMMMFLVALAHRAGLKDAKVVAKHRLNKNDFAKVKLLAQNIIPETPATPAVQPSSNQGFMQRGNQ